MLILYGLTIAGSVYGNVLVLWIVKATQTLQVKSDPKPSTSKDSEKQSTTESISETLGNDKCNCKKSNPIEKRDTRSSKKNK